MKNTCAVLTGLAAILAVPAHAEIKLNDNFSVAGYAVGSYDYVDTKGAPSTDSFNLDASKIDLNVKFDPVTATFGIYYTQTGSGTNNLTLIDAAVTYNAGGGWSITGGRFLSWLGYEAFDSVNKNQASSAYINPNGTIMFYPAYHEGVKVAYTDKDITVGAALLDSVNGPTIYRGDGELQHNAGTEAFIAYHGVPGLTLWGGLAYDTAGAQPYQKHSVGIYNVWAQYVVGQATFAAEYIHQQAAVSSTGDDGLVELNYAFTDKLSTTFRISAADLDDTALTPGLSFTKFTVSPTYKVTANLLLRPEISYIKYHNDGPIQNDTFYAIQAIFKF